MLKVLELFAGYGSQALALENLGIEFTSDIAEIDKYAIQAYEQLHGKTHNWGDVTKIDETKLPYYDLITYSFPCQDISLAGLQKGCDNDSGTRSSLLWECERIIRAVKPKYLLMENVKNLVGEKHKHNFIKWLHVLEMMGYQNFYKVLNAKDYGVPQNRERVFVVSIIGCQQYLFPNPIKLEKRLKDVLESNVDEKYYLSDKTINMFLRRNELNKAKGNGFKFEAADTNGYASAVTTRAGARADDNFIQEPLCIGGMQKHQSILDDGTCTCLCSSMGMGGGYVPMVTEPLLIREATQKGYAEAYEGDSVTLDEPNSQTRRGRVGKQMSNTLTTTCNIGVVQIGNIVNTGNWDNPERGRIYSDEGVSPTLSTMQGGGLEPKILERSKNGFKNKRIYSLLRILWKTIREKEIWDEIGRFRCVSEKEILQQDMYEKGNAEIRKNEPNLFKRTYNSEGNKQIIIEKEFLRDVWKRIKVRRSSQRWGLSEQQFGKLNDCLQKLSYETTQTKEKMYFVWESSKGFELLRETLSEIQKIWKSSNYQQGTREFCYRIRKLTPRECWRLQGVKDEQFDKLHGLSNTQLYKLAGNSIVVDVLMGIFKNLLLSDEGTNGQLRLI